MNKTSRTTTYGNSVGKKENSLSFIDQRELSNRSKRDMQINTSSDFKTIMDADLKPEYKK